MTATPLALGTTEPPSAADEPPGPWAAPIQDLAGRFVRLARPLRILEAIRWPRDVEAAFFAAGCRELPRVDRATYLARPLRFDPVKTHDDLTILERDVTATLGVTHPVSRLLLPRCRQAHDVVELLVARGTERFAAVSARLYGRIADPLPSGSRQLGEWAASLSELTDQADDAALAAEDRPLTGEQAAHLLADRLAGYFAGDGPVKVMVTDRLDARAAVGGDWLKVHRHARFNLRDVRLLEVHEGWVHLGTSRNARHQPLAGLLGRLLPAATCTQEGLAVWTEVLMFASHPARLGLLCARVEAIGMAERGADFLDVFRFFRDHGLGDREAYQQAVRVYRGSVPTGGPFGKDLAYTRGFAEVDHFLRQAIWGKRTKQIAYLFCGKVGVADVPVVAELAAVGLVTPPRHVPPPFADPRPLAAWLCCTAAS